MDLTSVLDHLRHEIGIQVGFTQVILAFALLLARVMPVVILTPFLGGESVPSEVKMGLGVMLGLVLAPVITQQVSNIPLTAVLFVALMLKELFIGLSMAFVVGMIFEAAQSAGSVMDMLSGTNMAQVMVPQIQQQTTLMANLNTQLAVVLFLTLGGQHVVIEAFGDSLALIPLDQYPHFSSGMWPFFETIIRIFADLLRIAMALAAPVLLATFLTDIALGFINRVAPQVQVYFVSMQIKPMVAALVVFTSIHVILTRVVGEYGIMFHWLKRVLYLLS